VKYCPGESDTLMFGGNSNWRGPIWFPIMHLVISSLRDYHWFYGDQMLIEFPTGSGKQLNLMQIADEISKRSISIFLPNKEGKRPCNGNDSSLFMDKHWKDLILFYEHFHADTGRGLGAEHQTGWTALVAESLYVLGDHRKINP